VNLFRQPGQHRHALTGGPIVYTLRTGAEGNHNDGRGDDEHAGNNLQAQFHTVLTAIQNSIEETHEDAVPVRSFFLHARFLGQLVQHRGIQLRESLEAAALHDAGRDDGAAEGAEQAHQRTGDLAVADHGNNNDEAHAEGRTEVGQGDELVFLEEGGEATVLGQGDDGRVIREESHYGTQGGNAREVIQGFHHGTQEALQQGNHAELRHELGQRTRKHCNAHKVENRIEQQVVGRVHHGPDHVAAAHPVS